MFLSPLSLDLLIQIVTELIINLIVNHNPFDQSFEYINKVTSQKSDSGNFPKKSFGILFVDFKVAKGGGHAFMRYLQVFFILSYHID